MTPSHVALLSPVAPPAGGVQSHTEALRRRALEAGFRVTRVAITRCDAQPAPDLFVPRSAAELLRTVARLQPDIIHLHIGGNLTARLALLCAVCGMLPGSRAVLTFHSGGFPTSPRGLAANTRSFDAWCMRRLDAVVGVNPELGALFRRYGAREDRIHVISPHATVNERDIVSDVPGEIADFRARHARLAVSVGLLEPEYCLERQIDAIGRARSAGEDWGLVMVGSGSLATRLAEAVREADLGAHVMLTGDRPHGLALRLIRDADVLLRTTKYDGDAVSVREALQLGTPVLASDTGMRPDGVTLLADLEGATIAAAMHALPVGSRVRLAQPDQLGRILSLYRALDR